MKKRALFFKVDFEKAYDTLNWGFIDSVMEQMGFPPLWRKWIAGCLTSARTSVLVNGSPTVEFDVRRGIRQGDPMAPFLFIIAMEALHIAMVKARETGLIHGLRLPKDGPNLTHFFFADDVMFLADWLTLCKAVLGSLPTYYLSIFKAPITVIEQLERVRRWFLWKIIRNNSKIAWVAWDKARVVSAIHSGTRSWKSVPVKASIPGVWNNISKVNDDLANASIDVDGYFIPRIGRGNAHYFWLDQWGLEDNLKNLFPTLFALEVNKFCTIEERLSLVQSDSSPRWAWKRGLNLVERQLLQVCWGRVQQLLSVSYEDGGWFWGEDGCNAFSTKGLRRDIESLMFGQENYVHQWLKWVPIKVNAFIWRAVVNKIPTMESLTKRGIQIPDAMCKRCGSSNEDIDHLFFGCSMSRRVWAGIHQWTGLKVDECNSLNQVVSFPFAMSIDGKSRNVVYAIILSTCCWIWKARNAKVFRSENIGAEKILDNIKISSFTWLKHRAKMATVEWSSWCYFDWSWS
ncbi:uncharacterized protein LOC143545418 [Bidens hawaiensis]|uniref:uncharacterized protein LOC143545418 n=1 Tax=Bidens hawaiensis TaxID=980011 RepID=UPI0040497582